MSTNPTINIHPEAKSNFDTLGNALLYKLAPSEKSQVKPSFSPDIIPKATISIDEIEMQASHMTDPSGRKIASYFEYNGKEIGLEKEAFRDLVRLGEKFHKLKDINKFISYNFIESSIFCWCELKYKGNTDISLSDFLLNKCNLDIKKYTIWIPVAALHVESDIKIGNIIIKAFVSEFFEQMKEVNKSCTNNEEHIITSLNMIEGMKQEYQGRAAVTMTLYGEQSRVVEIAMKEGERALAVLRFFSASARIPGVVSYCRLEGRENNESYMYFLTADKQTGFGNGGIDPSFTYWTLPNEFINLMSQAGLQILSELLTLEKPTEFQESLIDSLFAYLRHTVAKDLSDKLLFIFTALDSFLLKGENEPIQQNISERIACVIGKNTADRRNIIKNIKMMYGLRSKFVHHNQQIDDLDILEEFLQIVWNFYFEMIHINENFKTKDDFINCLEEKRLSY